MSFGLNARNTRVSMSAGEKPINAGLMWLLKQGRLQPGKKTNEIKNITIILGTMICNLKSSYMKQFNIIYHYARLMFSLIS